MTETSRTETSKRTKLTKRQLDALQAAFSDGQMPDAAKRQVLADELGLTPRCVHVWFQNRRQRSRATMVPSSVYQVINSNGREHGNISSLLGFQVPPLTSAKPVRQPTQQPMQRSTTSSAPVRSRWHHTLLRTDSDLKTATLIPCVFDARAAAAEAISEVTQSQKRPSPEGTSAEGSGSPTSDATRNDGEDQDLSEELPTTKRARILKRTKLTEEQITILSAAFVSNPMPDTFKRQLLAAHLGLTPRCVHVWFQNRRQRLKMTEPKPALHDGQSELRDLQRPQEKRQTRETRIEAEPALRALTMMHTRASDTPLSVLDTGARQSDSSLSDDGSEGEEVVDVMQEEGSGRTSEPPIATAGKSFVHATSVDLSKCDDNSGISLLLACASKATGMAEHGFTMEVMQAITA